MAGGRLTDDVAIGLLTTTFPDEAVRAAIEATDMREQRNRALPTRLMVYLTHALRLDFDKGYVRVLRSLLSGLRWARGSWDGYAVPTDGTISPARDRLGSAPMKALFEATAKPTVPVGHEDVFWRGLRKVAADGTVFDLPASEGNAAAFGTPSGGVLPQARLVALAKCGSLALVGAALDSIGVGERTLLERLLGSLTPDMLLLANRGFPSYELYKAAAATGAQLL
ncbi:transposase domain-containing protein [Streptomyces sp. NPDC005146]